MPIQFDRQSGNSRSGFHARPASLITGLLFRAIVASKDLLLSPIVLVTSGGKNGDVDFGTREWKRMMNPVAQFETVVREQRKSLAHLASQRLWD